MQTPNYIIGNDYVSIIHDGKPVKVTRSDLRYDSLVEALKERDFDAVNDILSASVAETIVHTVGDGELKATADSITYRGVEVHGVLVDKIRRLIQDGYKDVERFILFLRNLMDNPSGRSVKELYDFLSYKDLPITEDGHFLAYKGVQENFYSSHGNKQTVVLQGEVNERGQILNTVGSVIEVARNSVDDERSNGCSFGLHAGSYDYGSTFSSRTLLVKINPADVVSVPSDCACQKVRVTKYEVLQEIERELVEASYDTSDFDDFDEWDSDPSDGIDDFIYNVLYGVSDSLALSSVIQRFPGIGSRELIRIIEALGYSIDNDDNITF